MGRPMARTLRAKLPRTTTVMYVYDVAPGAMDAFVRECTGSEGEGGGGGEGRGRGRVVACASCREVGENAVRMRHASDTLSESAQTTLHGMLTIVE